MKTKEIVCKTAIGKCGFPGGGWSINPYVGCEHDCAYCYARFMKRFTNHNEPWGSFVDVKTNIAEVLEKQIKNSSKFNTQTIFIGTVTDPYQPLEEKYKLTRKMLEVLLPHDVSVSILTKSDLILRDLDLLKKFKNIEVNFTINTLDEKWKKLVEPNSSSVKERLSAAKILSKNSIPIYAMVGPYWPYFTDPDTLFKEFKKSGITSAFSESFNTTGDNFVGVEKVLNENYPELLMEMKRIFFNSEFFEDFYTEAESKLLTASKKYSIPVKIYFARGHASKNKK